MEQEFSNVSESVFDVFDSVFESYLDSLDISYQDYCKHEIERTEGGDWIDVRAYRAKKILTKSIVEDSFVTSKGESVLPTLLRQKESQELKIETGVYDNSQVRFIRYKKGDFLLVDLGFSMVLPKSKEALLLPRSSTFKNTGLIQTNSTGVIDNSYCGKEDVWKIPLYATRDGFLIVGERIAQFRTISNMAFTKIRKSTSTENLDSRGGFGSTGEL